MDKETLKTKLDEVKAKIKINSKDAHFADMLVEELLSLKGQLGIEPTLVHIPTADIVSSLKGKTFEMSVTKHGDAIYHVYGGYTIIADGARMKALAGAIADYVVNDDLAKNLDDDEREMYELDMSATAHVLNIPMMAFADRDLKFDLASKIINWMRSKYDEALEQPLQDETPEQNAKFEAATKALEEVKSEVKKSKRKKA